MTQYKHFQDFEFQSKNVLDPWFLGTFCHPLDINTWVPPSLPAFLLCRQLSFRPGDQENWLAVRMILPAWFDHAEESFSLKMFSSKHFACLWEPVALRIGNSTVSRGIWDKYREWYFKIHQNITSCRCEWYLGSFEISRAGIYPKYPEETALFFVYTTRQRNFAFHITHEHIFLFSHAHLIGFTTTRDWL